MLVGLNMEMPSWLFSNPLTTNVHIETSHIKTSRLVINALRRVA